MAIDESGKKKTVFREWIIFAVSMGAGAHIALGMILHSPDTWDWNHTAIHTFLIGLSVYVIAQIGRSCWGFFKRRKRDPQSA
ncbi:MAG TPA: hypothetical protein EYN60_00385 [Nitrospirales bacterium]|nr:hypothetical protein [Nitrospirales bacterium]HIA13770.1 hypothetical protein [Nitrospirales bacterium]HIC04104.1 hypothetical protein [Nitrospirales bacterium]HIO68934.1 hypothetical protein [Nitrospirales bacterium]